MSLSKEQEAVTKITPEVETKPNLYQVELSEVQNNEDKNENSEEETTFEEVFNANICTEILMFTSTCLLVAGIVQLWILGSVPIIGAILSESWSLTDISSQISSIYSNINQYVRIIPALAMTLTISVSLKYIAKWSEYREIEEQA